MAYQNTKSIMIKTSVMLAILSFSIAEARDSQVRGYLRKDGTYAQPHGRTNPNSNGFDNYSAKGNSSPYTGRSGSVDPYQSHPQKGYRSGFGG